MKRIIWVAVTILIMLGIMGYGLHTLNHIEEVNQKRREKEAGEKFAATMMMTTATTSIWDKMRAAQATTSTSTGVPAAEGVTGTAADGQEPVTEAPEQPEEAPGTNEMTPPAGEFHVESITVITN